VDQRGTEFGEPTKITCKNKEVDMDFREYLRTRRSDLNREVYFKLVVKWGRCINVFGGCAWE
jgi:hypothetical protein